MILNLFCQFDTDHPAVMGQRDVLKDRTSHQPEVTIDIANFEAEQPLDRLVIARTLLVYQFQRIDPRLAGQALPIGD